MAVKDLAGVRFERLLVVSRSENAPDGTARWLCRCDCGQERTLTGTALRAGRNKSCGCASPRFEPKDPTALRGWSRTRTHRIWRGMLRRCSPDGGEKELRNYFNKGIRVCERWEAFECFLADMGEVPPGMSIERRNGSRGYSKSNCVWATSREQGNNTTRNSIVHHAGKSQTVAMWAREIGINQNTLLYRLLRGMPTARALQPTVGNALQEKAKQRQRQCVVCGGLFIPRAAQVNAGRGVYCSQSCHGKARLLK